MHRRGVRRPSGGVDELSRSHALDPLRRTLTTTNPIESALSVTRSVMGRVIRWRDGDSRRRWCGAGHQRAEDQILRIKGHRTMPWLATSSNRVFFGVYDAYTALDRMRRL
jgi:hypothetical protein